MTKRKAGQPSNANSPKPATEDPALRQLMESIARKELVVVVGTGVSIGLCKAKVPSLSWSGLIEDGFSEATRRGRVTKEQAAHWKTQLASNDIDERLSAAEFMGRKLGAPNGDLCARWLENTFNPISPQNAALADAIRSIHSAGIPICTLNYDTLLESVVDLPTINYDETNKVTRWMRGTTAGVFHLHGCWLRASTCILGIRDYETTIGNEIRDLIQRSLGTFKRLLFIGCGDTFTDPNFTALIGWLRSKLITATPQHYALVTRDQLDVRRADTSWQGFVEPLAYGSDHNDLPKFLSTLFSTNPKNPKLRSRKKETLTELAKNSETIIAEYCSYLVRDCGQMTIEGIRADIVTRKYLDAHSLRKFCNTKKAACALENLARNFGDQRLPRCRGCRECCSRTLHLVWAWNWTAAATTLTSG